MDPKEFQRLAVKLVETSQSGAANLRTAISRAYYAAYHTGYILLKDNMKFAKIRQSHGEISNYLNGSGEKDVVNAAKKLADLHSIRIKADYRLNNVSVENPKTVEARVKDADEIIKVLDSCATEPRRTQIKNAIQKWENKIYNTRA